MSKFNVNAFVWGNTPFTLCDISLQSEPNLYRQAHNSQLSLTSVGSHESTDTKIARSLFDYQVTIIIMFNHLKLYTNILHTI